jgi:hypothetical protein
LRQEIGHAVADGARADIDQAERSCLPP